MQLENLKMLSGSSGELALLDRACPLMKTGFMVVRAARCKSSFMSMLPLD